MQWLHRSASWLFHRWAPPSWTSLVLVPCLCHCLRLYHCHRLCSRLCHCLCHCICNGGSQLIISQISHLDSRGTSLVSGPWTWSEQLCLPQGYWHYSSEPWKEELQLFPAKELTFKDEEQLCDLTPSDVQPQVISAWDSHARIQTAVFLILRRNSQSICEDDLVDQRKLPETKNVDGWGITSKESVFWGVD